MNMFKYTEVTTTQHYTYCSESRCSSYCGFLNDILIFAARGEGEGYELVGVCRRESPPQASELLMRCKRFPWPLIPPVTLYPQTVLFHILLLDVKILSTSSFIAHVVRCARNHYKSASDNTFWDASYARRGLINS